METQVSSIDAPLSKIVAELNDYQPLLLHTYPTFLEVLCAEARRGALRIAPEIVTVGSEAVSQAVREAARRAFPRARFVETYACTECVAMATACPQGALHVNEDACILEPVDDELRPSPAGAFSHRVLLTNLLNTVQPLLRYELTDSVRLGARACTCGSPFATLEVQGRSDDTFYLLDAQGRAQVHAPIPIEVTFLGLAGLLQYQIVHEEQNRIRMCFVADRGAGAAEVARQLDERLSRYLQEHGLSQVVSYAIEEVDTIARHARSRKLRQITSRVGKPQAPLVAASAARG
jgi:phenylacetate-coenzyme A ligase PaaK-like adenylate-forming protein